MAQHAQRFGFRPRLLSATLGLLLATACSDDGTPAAQGTAGTPAAAGTNSSSAGTVGSGGNGTSGSASGGGGAATAGGGATTAGGGGASGGVPAGGANTGGSAAGTTSGGSAGSGGGSGGSGGGAGGSASCAGRVLSLSSNGTGMDADTAYSRVMIDVGATLPIGNAARTVQFWAFIKSTDWVGDKNEIYYYGTSGSTATAFGMDFGTNTVMGMAANHATLNPFTDGYFNVDSTADLGVNSSTDQWVHIAMTWDGTKLLTYVNGKLGITSTGNGGTMLATGAGSLMIGCNPENKACFNGMFAEFSVWNVARTDLQLQDGYHKALAGNETGLVGYWKLNDAAGSMTAADSLASGTKHPGTLMAAAAAQLGTFVTPPTALPLVCP